MRIGELARRAGTKIETIRYYERAGLLQSPPRTVSGYREYGESDQATLSFIRHCRALDLTLSETRELLRLQAHPATSCESANALLDQQIAQVGDRILALRQLERDLKALRKRCHAGVDVAHCGILGALNRQDQQEAETNAKSRESAT